MWSNFSSQPGKLDQLLLKKVEEGTVPVVWIVLNGLKVGSGQAAVEMASLSQGAGSLSEPLVAALLQFVW